MHIYSEQLILFKLLLGQHTVNKNIDQKNTVVVLSDDNVPPQKWNTPE